MNFDMTLTFSGTLFHRCTKTNWWPLPLQLTHPLTKQTHDYRHRLVDDQMRTLQSDILLLLWLFPPLITTTDEGWVTTSNSLWLLIAVYWHCTALRREGKRRLACSSMNTQRVHDSRCRHSVCHVCMYQLNVVLLMLRWSTNEICSLAGHRLWRCVLIKDIWSETSELHNDLLQSNFS